MKDMQSCKLLKTIREVYLSVNDNNIPFKESKDCQERINN